MARLADEGAFEDPDEKPNYEPYLGPLSDGDMEGAVTDEKTGIITKDGKGIGIVHAGRPVRGFRTPSRKLEVRSEFVRRLGKNEDAADLIAIAASKGKNRKGKKHHEEHTYDIPDMPQWVPIDEHAELDDDQLIMTSFKWNVHNHGRTANLKWCAEIVHTNPAWIHPDTAARFDLADGDWIEITGHRSKMLDRLMPGMKLGAGETGALRLPVVVTKGVHPRAIAISNSLGHTQYTNVARARRGKVEGGQTAGMDLVGLRDQDWERNMWWEDESGGDPKKWKKNTGPGCGPSRIGEAVVA